MSTTATDQVDLTNDTKKPNVDTSSTSSSTGTRIIEKGSRSVPFIRYGEPVPPGQKTKVSQR